MFGGDWEKLPDGYALWTASSGAGRTIGAGLPDITGTFGETIYAVSGSTTGAFRQTRTTGHNIQLGNWAEIAQMEFKASYSNDNIYGQSTTVQPPAYKIYAYRRTG